MIFVQYFDNGLFTNELIPACGDRAVVVLDGRQNLNTWHNDAKKFNGFNRPTYKAYQLFKGDTFTRCQSISEVIKL